MTTVALLGATTVSAALLAFSQQQSRGHFVLPTALSLDYRSNTSRLLRWENGMSTVGDVLCEIEEALGSRIYYAYEGERHLIDQAVAGAIALAILKDYLSGFLDLKAMGKLHRDYLADLVKRLRRGTPLAPADVDEQSATALAKSVEATAHQEGTRQIALDRLVISLVEFGLDEDGARSAAQTIAESASKLVRTERA